MGILLSHYFDAALWLPSWFGLSSSEWVYSVPENIASMMSTGIQAVPDEGGAPQCQDDKTPVIDIEDEDNMMAKAS